MHGKDISIPKGTEITAYVNGDRKMDLAKFQPVEPLILWQTAPPKMWLPFRRSCSWVPILRVLTSTSMAVLWAIHLTDVQIAEGEHTIAMKKVGFKDGERKLKITGGRSVHLNAELEKLPSP
jgi:hypothetical protein